MIKVKILLCGALCIVAVIITVIYSFKNNYQTVAEEDGIQALTLWQIDSFEGGTGSRAAYLQDKANDYKKLGGGYVNVISLSAEAARLNIESGNTPDLISFGGGEWGLENVINSGYDVECWCYGSYCLLSLGVNVDFMTANAENTVINEGKSNLAQAAALFCGLDGAAVQSSTYAYVDLINGRYEFLLGTQRDIYRLNARKVEYSVKAIGQFNDLYQLIAICSSNYKRAKAGSAFVCYLMENNSDVYELGMLGGEKNKNEKIQPLENKTYECKVCYPLSKAARAEIENIIQLKDINKLKTLLK